MSKLREALGFENLTEPIMYPEIFVVRYQRGGFGVKEASFETQEAAEKFIAELHNRGAVVAPISLKKVTTLQEF